MQEVEKVAKYLKKSAKYPTQDDAEFMAELANVTNNMYAGGSSLGRNIINQIEKIRQKNWDKVFGDKSPWKVERGSKGYKVKWDKDKAKNIGI